MKTILPITTLLAMLSVLATSAQDLKDIKPDSTVRYTKSVEPNRIHAADSLNNRKGLERLFSGDFNARLEFFFNPSFGPALGFRLFKTPNDTSVVAEIKWVFNYKEVNKQLNEEFPTKGYRPDDIISEEEHDRMATHNREMYEQTVKERLKRYKTKSTRIPISNTLADELYTKTLSLIDSAQWVGKSPFTIFDGERAIFRCVVNDNELRTLNYHVPEGDAKKLSDLFLLMIADAEANKFDQAKYLESLGN